MAGDWAPVPNGLDLAGLTSPRADRVSTSNRLQIRTICPVRVVPPPSPDRDSRPSHPRRRRRRRPHRPQRHRQTAGRVLGPEARTPSDQPQRAADSPRRRRSGKGGSRPHQHGDRGRAVHQPQHDKDAPREPHDQAERPQPRRARDVGLRNRPCQPLAGRTRVGGTCSPIRVSCDPAQHRACCPPRRLRPRSSVTMTLL